MTEPRKGIFLNSITFGDGTVINLQRNSVLLITGPNNCGKSQTLRDICSSYFATRIPVVIRDASFGFDGDLDDVYDDVIANPIFKPNFAWIAQQRPLLKGDGRPFFKNLAHNNPYQELVLTNLVTTYLSTFARLLSLGVTPENSMGVNVQPVTKASLARLYEDKSIADKIYDLTKNAFGKGVMMNHASFQDSDLYFVDRLEVDARPDLGKSSFARWFENLGRLNQQGDGVQAFCAILIPLIQQITPLILLDEPEAFLHPPQIRELARIIATERAGDTQLIISTHSDDFLRGMIDFAEDRVTVIRITKEKASANEINVFKKLESSDISTLWRDPLLKTSDVLTSLFHRVAVIVEGDSDARFFRALLDKIEDSDKGAIDIKFFHCGGKDKIPKIAEALRAIGVPVICVVDIDVLDNKEKFLKLVESFGGDRNKFVDRVIALSKFVADQKTTQTASDAKTKLEPLFSGLDPAKGIPSSTLQEMYEVLKSSSAWSLIKRGGEGFFTAGDPYLAWKEIYGKAEQLGILINAEGELESLCKTISAKHKADWLSSVLQKDLKQDPDLNNARVLAERLLNKCREFSGA